MNKKTFIPALLVFSMISSSALAANQIGVAATVDGSEIFDTRLQKSIDTYLDQQGTNIGAIRDPKRFKEVRNKVLDILIGQELLWQAAQKANTIVSNETVDAELQKIKAQFKDEVSFEIKIQAGGFNAESFRQNLKQKLSAQSWIQNQVLSQIQINQDEIHEFYEANKSKLITEDQVRARHILIKSGDDASQVEAAVNKLIDLKQQVAQGAKFEELAKQYSEGPSAPKGGDLGYFTRGKMVKPFEQAAFQMERGEISGVVQTRFGHHLIQLVDKQPARQLTEAEIAPRIESLLWQQKSQSAVDDAIVRLKEQAKIIKSASLK